MKNRTKFLLVFASAALLSCPVFAQQMGGMKMNDHQSMHGSPDAEKAPYDLQFIDTMSQHHRMGIDMMKLAEQRAKHSELKEMARKGIEEEEKEVQQMQGWKTDWYPNKPDAMNMNMPGMKESMKGMSMNDSMEKLSASSGEAFDKMFIDMMSKHHLGAIAMSKDAIKNGKHEEIKQFAQKLIDEQKAEIAQMAKWKKEWKLADK